MPSPRNAPRREAVSITKLGRYGKVVWAHQLICGHTVTRKRKSPTGVIGCVKCMDAEEFEELNESLGTPLESPIDDGLSEAEAKAMKYKAILAGRFGIPSEQIDVSVRTAPRWHDACGFCHCVSYRKTTQSLRLRERNSIGRVADF